jgi:uncharacterized cupin superfamily protein
VCFPEGPDGAHHTRNDTDELVRVALLSTKSAVGIAEYPDTDKIGVWPGDGTTTCSAARRTSSTGTASVREV